MHSTAYNLRGAPFNGCPESYKKFSARTCSFGVKGSALGYFRRALGERISAQHCGARRDLYDQGNELQDYKDTLKVVGVGQRSAKTAAKLIGHGFLDSAQTWHVDFEARANDVGDIKQKLLLANEKAYKWAQGCDVSDLLSSGIVLRHANTSVARQQAGHALILAAAGSVPGGPESVLSIVDAFRAAGNFTAVAITLPFSFEGARRVDSAQMLVQSLQSAADLVCIVQQNALMAVTANVDGSPMTVADATSIADNAQASFVKLLLATLDADEVLTSVGGTTAWQPRSIMGMHGPAFREMRAALKQSMTCSLGRGAAALPANAARSVTAVQRLVHVATDAVCSAAESPFLESLVNNADCAWCHIKLPRHRPAELHGSTTWQTAAREACQAAAATLQQMTPCKSIIVFYTMSEQADPSFLTVEASVLLSSQNPGSLSQNQQRCSVTPQDFRAGSASHSESSGLNQAGPNSTWKAMSAMAGGSTTSMPPRLPPKSSQRSLWGQQDGRCGNYSPKENESLGDRLADSLIAQSLDLPPKAAKWRQQQRAKTERPRMMVKPPEGSEDDTEESITSSMKAILSGDSQQVDIRQRMFAILERDRDDAQ